MPAFKKNDRVEFSYKNETIYGVVTRGGATVSVTADGGKYSYRVGAGGLRHSTQPLPKDPPHPMDAYTIRKYSPVEAMSEETLAFTAEIQKDGTSILSAKNNGHGGCNIYYPLNGGYDTVKQFEDDVKKWLIDHGMAEDDIFEASDYWLTWKTEKAPFGVTAAQYIAETNESMAEFSNPADEPESNAPKM